MSSNFDWETEEDERRARENIWDEPSVPDSDTSGRKRPPWRLIAVVIVMVGMIGAIIWWRVDRRIDATLQAFRTDIVASHNLVQRAVAEGDEEIFRSVLSGRLPAWTAGQLAVFQESLFYDRSPLGLLPVEGSLPVILPAPNEETPAGERAADIEFSPDLNEAVLTVEHPYQVEGTDETVVLRQTTVFRRGNSRWLLAPPMDEFWGDWVTVDGEYLSLIYPRRDEATAARLAEHLDAEIKRMCATLSDIDCSNDLYLTVRLDTDPDTLAALAQPLGALQRASEREDILELPAPTLVGLPVEGESQQNEAAFEALANGYTRHVLGAAIAQAVNWHCCDNALLFSILLEYQLGELGVADWSIDAADHQRILDSRVRLSDLSTYLRARFPTEIEDERLWQLRAAVDFLAEGLPDTSAAGMQRILGRSNSFGRFLDGVLTDMNSENGTLMPNNLDLAWWLFALNNSQAASEPPALPADQELYLSCTAVEGNQSTDTSILLRYAPDEETWVEMYNLQGFIWMSALPDPEILLMQEFRLEEEAWQTNVWRDGGISPAYIPDNGRYAISFGETNPSGQKMVAYSYNPQSDNVRGFVIDLADCDDGCATTDTPGRPVWSPDGEMAIYVGGTNTFPEDMILAANGRHILLEPSQTLNEEALLVGPGDAAAGSAELTDIGAGRSPFWLDDRTYGYVRRLDTEDRIAPGVDEIVVASIDDPTPTTVITAADLFEFLPEGISPRRRSIAYVATHPQQPDRLFIVVLDNAENKSYVILYDLETRLPEVRLQLLYNLNHSLSFSPDGRHLVMTGQDRNAVTPGEDSAVLLVHNIEENRTIPLLSRLPFFLPSVVYDWTADGRWLAIAMEDNLIGLVAPDEGFTRLVAHGYGACTSVAWLRD